MMDKLISQRRKQMARWAVENLSKWPAFVGDEDADPSIISCRFVDGFDESSLPQLECSMGGERISSVVWFYARLKK